MGVSNKLLLPDNDEEFEAMCHVLYGLVFKGSSLTRMGGHGQKQFGVDILGHDTSRSLGIQCKRFTTRPFNLATIKADVEKIEKDNLNVDHVLFATTASSKSEVVKAVFEYNNERRAAGKFSVSVNFWEDISGYIRLFPEVGRSFIPGFAGSTVLEIKETTDIHLELYQNDKNERSQILTTTETILQAVVSLQQNIVPQERGDEADPRVVTSLNLIRDKLREGKCKDAFEQLQALGDPTEFKDQFSRFRWYTNNAFVDLLEGRQEAAADGFLNAFTFAPEDEKANANRTQAFILKKDYKAAFIACEDGLDKFPLSELIWSLKLYVLQALGDPEPTKNLPASLKDSSDILFALAHLEHLNGNQPAALDLLRLCMKKDGGSFNAKRTYLADALTWCSVDSVLAHHGQLTSEQRSALFDAVSRLEPLEQTISAIQSDITSEELANNVTLALILLDNRDRADSLAAHLLAKHPLLEGLLRIRLLQLEERNDISGIHKLTDENLEKLPPPILAILAEISAQRGDKSWYDSILKVLEVYDLSDPKLESIRILSINLTWNAGAKSEAIQKANQYLEQHPENTLARVMLGQMLRQQGQISEAKDQAAIIFKQLPVEAPLLDILHLAELFYALKEFSNASLLYSKLVKVPGNNEFTQRLLACLVESDQRRKAQDILKTLTPEALDTSIFRRIEANLARKMGDWVRMRELLGKEIADSPGNAGIAVGYVGALYRMDEVASLKDYLASNPVFNNASPEQEFEFSKYQANMGFTDLAIRRLYNLYKQSPMDTRVASYFLGQILMGRASAEMAFPSEVGAGSTVYLEHDGEKRCIAIDLNPLNHSSGWTELISPDSEIANLLLGLKVGDEVHLPNQFGNTDFQIVGIESIFSFAATKAHETIANSAEPTGPLWSARIIKEDGSVDISMLMKNAQYRKDHVQRIFDIYKEHRIPIAMMAQFLGTDPVTLFLEWPYRDYSLFVGMGTVEERDSALHLLQNINKKFVLDLVTLAELVNRKSFEAVIKVIGRPMIPMTSREHLMGILELAESPQASGSMGLQNDQLTLTETPPQYYDDRLLLLKEMLRCIDEHCDVELTVGPADITDAHRMLAEAVDVDSLDAVYLSIEKDAVLISEDGAFRFVATVAGVKTSLGTQPILLTACDQGHLSGEEYADIVFGKLASGHDFVTIRAEDMLLVANRNPLIVAEKVKTAIDTFRKSTLDVPSGVRVCVEFIARAIQLFPSKISVAYIQLILEALKFERLEMASAIEFTIAQVIDATLSYPTTKMANKDRMKFTRFLNVEFEEKPLKRNLISWTIQNLYKQK